MRIRGKRIVEVPKELELKNRNNNRTKVIHMEVVMPEKNYNKIGAKIT